MLIAFSFLGQLLRADEVLKTQGVESRDEDVSTIADGMSDDSSRRQLWRGQRRRGGRPQGGLFSQPIGCQV